MLTKYFSKDGVQFNSKYDCLNYEIDRGFIHICSACNGTKGHYEKKLVKYKEEIYDLWVGQTEVDSWVKCKYCDGTGFTEQKLIPKYKVHREIIGYE